MVARFETTRAADWRSRSRRAGSERHAGAGHAAETSETDRHRSLSLQTGRAGIFIIRPAQLHLSLRHRDEKTRPLNEEQMGRVISFVVTGWKHDRFHE